MSVGVLMVRFRTAKAAIKLHTPPDPQGAPSTAMHITDGNTHELTVLDGMVIQPRAFY